ncbi:MAG: galactokinase [Firmicutes bacterium]|nr:galactokinase [Bacillota bacterium]
MERIFSAPGRVEIGGNHTDHQHGRVLAAAVDLDTVCAAVKNDTRAVRIADRAYGVIDVDLTDLSVREHEKGASAALIRGVAAWFHAHGYAIGGFDGRVTSSIPSGSGLSSSAAFEVLTGNVFRGLFGGDVSPLEIAIAGQYAENVYFGKPCGLMDQTASSFGGLILIDFENPKQPVVTPIHAAFEGYDMCVVNTGGSHADLTGDYAAIPREMGAVAAHFGKTYLREVPPDDFYAELRQLRRLGDRAVLRAMHFFEENDRVLKQAAALERGDMAAFFSLVIESGRSSLALLQNVYSPAEPNQQGLTLALALSERILSGTGAWRVHGGGFAGTILAFMPTDLQDRYRREMEAVFGEGCCHFLNIRQEGGMEISSNG